MWMEAGGLLGKGSDRGPRASHSASLASASKSADGESCLPSPAQQFSGKGGGCIALRTAELHGLLLRSGMFISTTMAQFLAKKSWKSQAGPP